MPKFQRHLLSFLTFLLLAIFILNFVSKYWTEYAFVFFILALGLASACEPNLKKRWGQTFPELKGIGLAIAFLLISILVSHLVNNNLGRHQISELGEYRWLLCIYPLVVFIPSIKNKQYALAAYFATISILGLFWSCQYLSFPTNGVIGYPNRLTGFFDSPTDFAHAIQFPLIVSLSTALLGKNLKPKLKATAVACLLITSLTLILSYTRASQLACLVAALSICCFVSRKTAIAVIASVSVLFVTIKTTNVLGLWDRINIGTSITQTTDYATAERLVLMRGHWAMFLDNPYFGVGYHQNHVNLRPYYDKMGIPPGFNQAHAHNQVLNFLSGTGILGAAAYICLMLLTLFYAVKNIRAYAPLSFEKAIAVGTFAAMVGFIVAGFTDSNFELMAAKYNFLIVSAIIIHQRLNIKKMARN